MIADLSGSRPQLPALDNAADAVRALEWDEKAVPVFLDDPHLWITLVQAVHNALYQPGELPADLYRNQLARAYSAVVEAVQEAVGADGTGTG